MEKPRNLTIDLMRGLAIFLLIPSQVIEEFIPTYTEPVSRFINLAMTIVTAPLFMFLVGITFYKWVEKENDDFFSLLLTSLKKACLFFIAGIINNFAIYGLVVISDILSFVGVCYLVLPFFIILKNSRTLWFSLVLLLIAPPLREWINYGQYWRMDINLYTAVLQWSWPRVFHEIWLTGFFPLIPWLCFPLLGLWLVRLDPSIYVKRLTGFFLGLLFLGCLSAILNSLYTAHLTSGFCRYYLTGWNDYQYPMTTSLLLITSGVLGLIYLFFYFNHLRVTNALGSFAKTVTLYSRYSLSCYFMAELSYRALVPRFTSLFSGQGFHRIEIHPNFLTCLVLGFGIVLCEYPILKYFEKYKGVGSFEWMYRHALKTLT